MTKLDSLSVNSIKLEREREKIKVTWNKRNGSTGKQLLLFLEGAPRPSLCSRQHEAVEAANSQCEADPVQVLPPALASCESLGESHPLSKSQFSHLLM